MIHELMELTKLDGVSGDEGDVRSYIKEKISGFNYNTDSMGNLIVYKKGTDINPKKVMLSAHMDEVGLMITGYGENSTLKFTTVGGIDSRILVNQRVRIGKDKILGVIGCKPIHLLDKAERQAVIKQKSMYIDIGAKDKEQLEKWVTPGDFAAFDSDSVKFGNNKLKAKALDDRVGCVVLLELLKNDWQFDLYACFTVQEEVGLRGSQIAAYSVKPDIAIVLEGTTCADVPMVKDYEVSTQMGKGPALTIMDRTSISNTELLRLFEKTAKDEGIPFQFKQTTTGGNDAGKIQTTAQGVKVISVSVPCRYIHSPVSVMDIDDFYNMHKLVKSTLLKL